MTTFNQEQLLFHRVWRKAMQDGRVRLDLPTERDATRLRFGLYNSVKLIRAGKVVDHELKDAVDNCLVRIEGKSVTVERRALSSVMQTIAAALGEGGGAGQISADPGAALETNAEIDKTGRELLERLKREQASVNGEDKPTGERSTPYYTR